jgi:hypothetical protein
MHHGTRLFMLANLVGFATVETRTTLFEQFPLLQWGGLVVVLAILVSTARCAHGYWRELREEGVELPSR